MTGGDLPNLPSAILRLLEGPVPGDDATAFAAAVAAADDPLAERLVEMVNRPPFAFDSRVATIDRAARLMGASPFRRLAIEVAVHDGVVRPLLTRSRERDRFWLHCLAVAVGCREVARQLGLDEDRAHAAGLLHDVGKALLRRADPAAWCAHLERVAERGLQASGDEAATLGQDHALVGAGACRRWGLPSWLVEAVAGHHAALDEGLTDLARVVQIADFLAWSQDLGSLPVHGCPPVGPSARAALDRIDRARVRSAVDRTIARSAAIFNLEIPDPDRLPEALADTSLELSRTRSEHGETQRILQAQVRELAALNEAIDRARKAQGTKEVLHEILVAIQGAFSFDRVLLFLPDEDRRRLRGRVVAGGAPLDLDLLTVGVDPSAAPCYAAFGRVLAGQGPIRIDHTTRPEASWLAALGIEEMGLVPIRVDGATLGLIGVDRVAASDRIEPGRLESLMVLAQEAGLIIEKARLEKRAADLETTDPLTRVATRRRFDEVADYEFERARRYARPLSVAVIEIDRFEDWGKDHGRGAAEELLRGLARLLERLSRTTDLVGRGESGEFLLLLPETNPDAARLFADRVEAAFASLAGRLAERFRGPPTSIRLGLASWSRTVPSARDLVGQAARSLTGSRPRTAPGLDGG